MHLPHLPFVLALVVALCCVRHYGLVWALEGYEEGKGELLLDCVGIDAQVAGLGLGRVVQGAKSGLTYSTRR